jgi:glutaredoxin 3
VNSDTPSVKVYSTSWCGSCVAAKRLLDARAIPYTEVNLDDDPAFRAKLIELTGRFTVPQIFIGDNPIGGFDQLRELDRSGRLAELVEQVA